MNDLLQSSKRGRGSMLIFFFLVESGEGWEVWEMKRGKTVFTTEENFVGLLRIQKR